jgi:predicted nuclease of predicted toxin-antitoxin system
MKLLLDENLSRRLVPFLLTAYPGSTQVVLVGLEAADDTQVWQYAKTNDFVIVTQDADFEELSLVRGHPPGIIWIKTSHPTRSTILKLLLDQQTLIDEVLIRQNQGCIEITHIISK